MQRSEKNSLQEHSENTTGVSTDPCEVCTELWDASGFARKRDSSVRCEKSHRWFCTFLFSGLRMMIDIEKSISEDHTRQDLCASKQTVWNLCENQYRLWVFAMFVLLPLLYSSKGTPGTQKNMPTMHMQIRKTILSASKSNSL